MTGLNRVDLNLLPLLAALLDHRNITKAAEAVGLTQPAMSNALGRLRRTLNDELLVRVGNNNVLTARAEALRAPVKEILAIATDRVLRSPTFDPLTSRRVFHIAASGSTASIVLPSLYATIEKSAPGVQILVEPLTALANMRSAESTADVALLPEGLFTTLPREHFYTDDLVVVADASNEHIGEVLSEDDLARLPHAVFEYEGQRIDGQVLLEKMLPTIQVRARVPEFLMIPAAIRGTTMVALLQRRLACRVAEQAGLRIHETPLPLPPQDVDLVWHPRNMGDPACDWLQRALRLAVQ